MNETDNTRQANEKNETPDGGKSHLLDLKLPVGWLFSAIGLVLTVYGLLSRKEMYERSLGINVNLIWGVILFLFGAAFLLVTFLKKRAKSGLKRG